MPQATAKQEAEELLAHLPDGSTLEDIEYHLYVLEKIKRGQTDSRPAAAIPGKKRGND